MSDGADRHADVDEGDRYAQVLDRMIDGVLGLDTEWRLTYLNERTRELICDAVGETHTVEELVGRSFWELLPGARGTTFEERYREAMQTGETVTFEEYFAPLDVWFEVRAYPSSTGLTICFRDITERRRRREELEFREATLREMYEVIADGESCFETRIDDLLRIGQRVFDTDYGTLSRVQGDEYIFEVVRAPDDSLAAGDVVDLETTSCERIVLTEETLVLANVAAEAPEIAEQQDVTEFGVNCYLGTPVIVEGDVYGTFCFYSNEPRTEPFSDWEVTLVDLMGRWVSVALERKLVAERLRRQNDRLERFATLVSHDLRNPLNVADGWLDTAREECDNDLLDKVEESHDRMAAIIEDVLAVARAGQEVEDPAELDLAEVAKDAWAQVRTEDATLTVADGLDVCGDRTRVQQLLENLFRNSVEHSSTDNRTESDDSVDHRSTDDGSGASVAVTVGSLPDDGGFYVADDGPGIPADERKAVLEFGVSTAEGGTGIGLGVVEDIAAAHDWPLRVTNSETGGARFEFVTDS
ncbi:ATP-binding protein [Haloplanus ruber]|uniref:histidine kinase n=1 Tax=Haloplanus ruber TaxID=869892 RepID=A0ABD6CXL6_9EURY|nr:ATP-binding protein [Haloplanus ruber]